MTSQTTTNHSPWLFLGLTPRNKSAKLLNFVLKIAWGVVVQGGNTNLTGSASTSTPDSEVLISLTRMKNLVSVDTKRGLHGY